MLHFVVSHDQLKCLTKNVVHTSSVPYLVLCLDSIVPKLGRKYSGNSQVGSETLHEKGFVYFTDMMPAIAVAVTNNYNHHCVTTKKTLQKIIKDGHRVRAQDDVFRIRLCLTKSPFSLQ